ncbi:PepSY-associated TM helix domain-containing protein [Paenibacillus sp. SI8]|uniref:PepSY-associated TM helix domain-containing protein n=1 Tax=unclassified Paenibacillus TaxID=185978 RepID=UPI003467DC32
MRKIVLTIHLFLSLILGLFVVVTCTTGSLLMIEPDVERLFHPIAQQPTPGDVGVKVIQQQADAMNPDLKSDRIEWPAQDGFYHIHLTKDGGKDAGLVYADPGTGEVFGEVQQERREPFATIYSLHRYFLLTNVIGKTQAAFFVGYLGIGLLLILLTGAYLWWPGLRKWALGFRVIRNRGKLAHNMSLHKMIGIISIPVLLIITLTGVVNAYEKSLPVWIGFKAKEEIPASALQSKSKDKPILTAEHVVDMIKKSYPDSKITKIQLPQKPGQTFQVGLKEGFGASTNSNSTVYMDASTGDILYKTNPDLAINLYNTWRKGLHFATWGGEAAKLVYFVFGMMPLILMFTGIIMWQLKARARKRNNKKKTADAIAA